MNATFARIVLRYVAMFLVTKGILDQGVADTLSGDLELMAALEMLIGLGVAAAVEVWHWVQLKFSKSKIKIEVPNDATVKVESQATGSGSNPAGSVSVVLEGPVSGQSPPEGEGSSREGQSRSGDQGAG